VLPRRALSAAGVPSAITRPPSTTAIRSASRSASSRYWVVRTTVVPSATSSPTIAQTSLRLRGSRPVVGSSRKRTGGRCMSAAARSMRRRMPPEYVRTGRSASWARSKRSSSSAARGRTARRGRCASRPIRRRFSLPVILPSTAAYWPARPMLARTTAGSSTTSRPRTTARPESGSRIVASTRIVVVFPAPFGPSSPNTVAVSTSRWIAESATTAPKRFVSASTRIATSAASTRDDRVEGLLGDMSRTMHGPPSRRHPPVSGSAGLPDAPCRRGSRRTTCARARRGRS
jgi:hypothetical protein